MKTILNEFIGALDVSLKKHQAEGQGIARLTISQLQYIEAIYKLGETPITAIAERLKLSKASVTVGVNKLVELGYVNKNQSTEDKRVFHARLTEAGRQLVAAKEKALEDYASIIQTTLDREEAEQFSRLLQKITTAFKQAENH